MEQATLPVEIQTFTDAQRKSARDALFMWQSLPCNPTGVALALYNALSAELAATNRTSAESPAAVLINWALQGMLLPQGNVCLVDIDVLVKAVDGCRERVKGTEYDHPSF